MKIKRELCGQIVEIELTDTELYQAYRKYCVNSYMFDVICNLWYHAIHWKNYKRAQQQRQAELHYLSSDRHQAVFQDKLCYVLSLAFEQQLQYIQNDCIYSLLVD